MKSSVCVSAILTGIWVTSGCLLAKQYADYQDHLGNKTKDEEDGVNYSVTILGIVAIAWCFATSIAWVSFCESGYSFPLVFSIAVSVQLSLAVFEGADLRSWLYERKLRQHGWERLKNFEEGYAAAEVTCKPTNFKL